MTSEIFSRGQAFLAQGTDQFFFINAVNSKSAPLITSRYIAMQSSECVIISNMFLIYLISYGCNDSALVFLGGAEASASPSFALPMFITIKQIIILHLFLGVPAATLGGTGTPWAHPWLRPWYRVIILISPTFSYSSYFCICNQYGLCVVRQHFISLIKSVNIYTIKSDLEKLSDYIAKLNWNVQLVAVPCT